MLEVSKRERIDEIIADSLNVVPSEIKPTANFKLDLDADSLDVIQLVLDIEEEFDIEIPDEAIDGIATVQELYDYLETKTA